MIPIAQPNLDGNEKRYLEECIETNYVSSVGPFVDRIEQHVMDATEAAGAVATSSGTAALHVALIALNVSIGDLVIVPSFTFIATANAVKQCGAEPWLMDIDSDSWTLDAKILENELRQHCKIVNDEVFHVESGRRVAGIVAVHTLGSPADMASIMSTANEWQLPVLADAACAIGATYRGGNIGGCADVSVASFNGNKTITCGGGGAVFGMNQSVLDRIRHLSTTARVGDAYDHDEPGFNYRMTNVQAAVGCAQFERLDAFLDAKKKIYASYVDLASRSIDVEPFVVPKWGTSTHWLSGIVLPNELDSDAVRLGLRACGVESRSFWKPLHLQDPYANSFQSGVPVSQDLWNRIIVLPSSTNLTEQQLELVKTAVKECLGL